MLESILFLGLVLLAMYIYFLSERVGNLEKHIKELKEQGPEAVSKSAPGTAPAAVNVKTAPVPAAEKTAVGTVSAELPVIKETPKAEPEIKKETKKEKSAAAAEKRSVNWELFTGIKLFAWIGGFAAFLGIVLFTKFTIESGLLTPFVRICFGFAGGVAALVSGIFIRNKKYLVTSAVLSATGVVFIYVSSYAASAFYGFMSTAWAFIIMLFASGAAFYVAVDKNVKYVSLLAGLCGYLTPLLLSTGSGAIEFLSIYIALLTVTIMAIAYKKDWAFLSWLGAFGVYTILLLLRYKGYIYEKPETMAAIAAFFPFLFMGFGVYALRRKELYVKNAYTLAPFVFIFLSLLLIPSFFRSYVPAYVPTALFFVMNAALLVLMLYDKYYEKGYIFAATAVFFLLNWWTMAMPAGHNVYWLVGAYFGFFLLNGFIPAFAAGRNREAPSAWYGFFPAALILTASILIIKSYFDITFLWVVIASSLVFSLFISSLLRNAVIAVLSVFAVFFMFIVWLVSAGSGIFDLCSYFNSFLLLSLLVAFSGFFMQKYSSEIAGRFGIEAQSGKLYMYPAFNIFMLMPFFFLWGAMIKTRPADPWLFIISGLVLSLLILGLSYLNKSKRYLTLFFALIGMFFLEVFWYAFYFKEAYANTACYWFFVVFVFFFTGIFLLRRSLLQSKLPWFTAALSGLLQGFLIYFAAERSPQLSGSLAVIPAAFAVIYSIAAAFIMKWDSIKEEFQSYRVAVFVNFILLFVTLIFPAQLSKEWLTISWALEGLLLIYLFGSIKYESLKGWGFWVIVLSFIRLVFPDTSLFAVQTGSVLNGYLYTYAAVIAVIFAAGFAWKPENEEKYWIGNNRNTLFTMATVLLFVLLNVEIAAFFAAGGFIRFSFSISFAQSMAYTLCWGVFAIALFVFGMIKYKKAVRIAGLALLLIATFKLFLYDLWSLGALYKIGSSFGLAFMMMLVSFLYQKYVHKIDK